MILSPRFDRVLFALALLLSLGIAVLAWVGLTLVGRELWLEVDTFMKVIQIPPRFREVTPDHVFSEIIQTLWEAKVHFGMLALSGFLSIFSIYNFVKLKAQEQVAEAEKK